jgi:hypothetical protein
MQAIRLERDDVKATGRLLMKTYQEVPSRKHNASTLGVCDAGQGSAMCVTFTLTHLHKHKRTVAIPKN